MRALSVLSLKDNKLGTKEAGEVLGKMLKGNSVLKELDLSKNWVHELDDGDAPGFSKGISKGLAGNGALTSLHVGQNHIPAEEMRKIMTIAMHMDSMKILCEVPFKDKTLTELDVSGKNFGTEGALVVAGYLDDNGAISQFTFSGDDEDSKPVTMEISMTEADFSAKGLGQSGAIMVAAFLPKCAT
jgi:Ran GTPase-activating protein (RanGAP) involved in mRNA processing and transport